jgi:hypothetical protein
MSTVGNLNVKVSATTSAFEASMRKSAAAAHEMGKATHAGASHGSGALHAFAEKAEHAFHTLAHGDAIGAAQAGIASLVSSINPLVAIAVAAGGTFVVMSEHTATAAIAHAKLAERYGLTGEALKGLQRAAIGAGATDSELARGLTYLQRQLAAAAAGSDAAKAKFSNLGIKSDLSMTETLVQLANKTASAGSEAEKSQIAFSIFGSRGGNAMKNFLAKGGGAIEAAIERQKHLHVVMSKDQTDMLRKNAALWRGFNEDTAHGLHAAENKMALWWSKQKTFFALGMTKLTGGQHAVGELLGIGAAKDKSEAHAAASLESARAAEKFRESTEQLNKELEKEAVAIGKTTSEAKLAQAAHEGGKSGAKAAVTEREAIDKDVAAAKTKKAALLEEMELNRGVRAEYVKLGIPLANLAQPRTIAQAEINNKAVEALGKEITVLEGKYAAVDATEAEAAKHRAAELDLVREKMAKVASEKAVQGLFESLRDVDTKLSQLGKTAGQAKAIEEMAKMKKEGVEVTGEVAHGIDLIAAKTDQLAGATALQSFNEGLRVQAAAFGKGAKEAAAYELAQKGVTGAALAGAIAAGKQADQMARIKGVVEKESPLEKFGKDMEALQGALAMGKDKGGIDKAQFDKGAAAIGDEFLKSAPKSELPKALTYGSAAAESAVIKAQKSDRDAAKPVQEVMKNAIIDAREIARQQLIEQKRMGDLMEKLNVPKLLKL